eukprot:10618549-Alexandrium_andersonii.AAC.1
MCIRDRRHHRPARQRQRQALQSAVDRRRANDVASRQTECDVSAWEGSRSEATGRDPAPAWARTRGPSQPRRRG